MAKPYVPYAGPVVTRGEALAAGLTRYFTGKPCRRGHLSQRRTVNHQCIECNWNRRCLDARNAAERANRVRNPEPEKARVARYTNSPKGKATRHAYSVAHSKEAVQRNQEWRERNPQRALETRQAHYNANKDDIVRKVTEWNAANPEGPRTRGRNYRAKSKAAVGSHTRQEIEALYEKQNGRCVYCAKSLGKKYHADHIVALSKGGSNWISNIQLTCAKCNNNKRATDPITYARRIGRLI